MSMWLELAKIEPSLLTEVREKPELIHALFFQKDDPAPLPQGFRPGPDSYGEDYRNFVATAEAPAETEEGTTEWGLARATGHGCEVIDGYDEFCYGPAFVLTPGEVRQVAKGLVAEGWDADEAADRDEEDEDGEVDEFEDLGAFFAAAAAEGRAVIGGVN
ncbi:hypothetical protein [Streptomyces sp. NPDC018693]|uniref:hypothetical protein n=1 Tax=unclassified Streptomyces TaxID=2593676 RepID=UPI0037A650FB